MPRKKNRRKDTQALKRKLAYQNLRRASVRNFRIPSGYRIKHTKMAMIVSQFFDEQDQFPDTKQENL